jgi:hypothetical protein
MKLIGHYLLWIGVLVAVADVVAIFGHFGIAGASWIINVAVAKLGFVAAGGLMAVGASLVRVGRIREARRLASGSRARMLD